MTIANLFQDNASTATPSSTGTLAGTQQLTNISAAITEAILTKANEDLDTYSIVIANSVKDIAALDNLIIGLYNVDAVSIDFLKALDEDTLDSMLKSQQSKKSRCKSKEMTMDNYKSMMTAAVAEKLIRLAMGKDKGAFGGRSSGPVAYTAERLEQLASDQDALRKEIRNVQSKKSIMKSKAGFSESDEKWRALLVAEEQLKSIRSDASTNTVTVVDPLRDELKEFLASMGDIDKMKAADLRDAIAYIDRAVRSDETEELTDDEANMPQQ